MNCWESSDRALEVMFGAENWQFHRIISEADLQAKHEIIVLESEVDKYILPGLKKKDGQDLKDGKAVNILAYDEESGDKYELKLQFERPYYRLRDTTELYQKMPGVALGQQIGFRYEAHFATLVLKLLK
ncbi:hypothetical protein OWV82_019132 [Melia azedarach]|uniref:Uncharacterized protein n=1 Tax=Melia azedarach TaxID=155640 RepID=A0ACC1XEU7_MELAZ|nr:hypothetical protein OWV82_019132 [Melia azedarach]